jgi:ubiquitin carboxyl-terminal hydrolase 7
LEENYGGEPAGALNNTKPNGRTFKRFTNAYMLVYIRKSMLDDILADVTVGDIPQHLSKLRNMDIATAELTFTSSLQYNV